MSAKHDACAPILSTVRTFCDQGAFAHAEVVDAGQDEDGQRRRELAAHETVHGLGRGRRGRSRARRAREGKNAPRYSPKPTAIAASAAGHDDQESAPAVEEAPERAVGLA